MPRNRGIGKRRKKGGKNRSKADTAAIEEVAKISQPEKRRKTSDDTNTSTLFNNPNQPGNFWSANCWDRSLNSDTQESATCHSILTHDLPANHPAKFGRATPKAREKTFLTLLDPDTGVVPTPERIVQDFDRVFYDGLPTMIKDRGVIQGSHDGQRYKKKSTYSKNWGGKRVRKLGFDEYRRHKVHPLALEGMRIKIENSKQLYNFGDTNIEEPNEITMDDLDPMDEDEESRIVAEIE